MRFEVPNATKSRKSGGSIDFSGKFSPLAADANHTLSAEMDQFLLPFLIGEDLGRFFLGRVDTLDIPDSNYLNINPLSPKSGLLELKVTNSLDSRIDLVGFDFLQRLVIAFDDRWYEFPNFKDDVAMVVRRTSEKVEVTEINLISRGRMAVRGSISSGEAGKISGVLRIGIPETTLSASKDKRLEKIFGQVREGYRWLDLKISGTSALPQDNLKTLILDTSPDEISELKEENFQDSFEELIEGE
jgi:hypothetical protein